MSRRLALWIGLDRVATLVSEIISCSIPSGGCSRSHALRCDRHALIMQMSLGLVRAAVNERCTCIRVPSSGETSGLRVGLWHTRVCMCMCVCRCVTNACARDTRSIFHSPVNFQVALATKWWRDILFLPEWTKLFFPRKFDMYTYIYVGGKKSRRTTQGQEKFLAIFIFVYISDFTTLHATR